MRLPHKSANPKQRVHYYAWRDRIHTSPITLLRQRFLGRGFDRFFHGNAGDLFNEDLLQTIYPETEPRHSLDGPRIFCVGSVAHRLAEGDLVCGIGVKNEGTIRPVPNIHVMGVRGPLSFEILKRAGFDMSRVVFQYDPGLHVSDLLPSIGLGKKGAVFVPHYRERQFASARVPTELQVLSPDRRPLALARRLQEFEFVFSSSLHGLIFAHALGIPAALVLPSTPEPELKYRDYLATVRGYVPIFASPSEISFANLPSSAPEIPRTDLSNFPSLSQLSELGIARGIG